MRGNRSTDTRPEVAVRSRLHRRGLRFRKTFRIACSDGTKVRPDVVFTKAKVAIFIDGCFWHCCPRHGNMPRANSWYWTPKLEKNVERDALVDRALQQDGWLVLRFWEHGSADDIAESIASIVLV